MKTNQRYLEALAVVNGLGIGQRELERRCAPVYYQGRMRRALQPLAADDQASFRPRSAANTPCVAFATVNWRKGYSGQGPTILGSDAANVDASVGGSVCYG